MGNPAPDEYFALLFAALVFIIVLVVNYMCIQLYHLRKSPPQCGAAPPAPPRPPRPPARRAGVGRPGAQSFAAGL
jgi:hypothetical protein